MPIYMLLHKFFCMSYTIYRIFKHIDCYIVQIILLALIWFLSFFFSFVICFFASFFLFFFFFRWSVEFCLNNKKNSKIPRMSKITGCIKILIILCHINYGIVLNEIEIELEIEFQWQLYGSFNFIFICLHRDLFHYYWTSSTYDWSHLFTLDESNSNWKSLTYWLGISYRDKNTY